MFKCNECGYTFDSPKKVTERHGLDNPPYEKRYECPNCNSEDFDDFHEVDNSMPRTDVIRGILKIKYLLNSFQFDAERLFGQDCFENNELGKAQQEINDLFYLALGDTVGNFAFQDIVTDRLCDIVSAESAEKLCSMVLERVR